jgi:uncharacterized membrane protein YesL
MGEGGTVALLSMDSKFMKFMDQFVDLLLLNLLWLVFSLPLFTMGAATVAASSLILKGLDGDAVPLVRSFWREFKANFRRGTGLGLLNAVAFYALFLDGQLIARTEDPPLVLLVVSVVSVAFVFLAFLYAYPLAARHHNSLRGTLQNSLLLCFRYRGRTFLLALLLVVEVGLFAWNTTMVFFGLVIGPMVLLSTVSGIARGIFRDVESRGS